MVNTKKWTIGEYPMPKAKSKSPRELVEELRGFNHNEAADVLEESLNKLERITEVAEDARVVSENHLRDGGGVTKQARVFAGAWMKRINIALDRHHYE